MNSPERSSSPVLPSHGLINSTNTQSWRQWGASDLHHQHVACNSSPPQTTAPFRLSHQHLLPVAGGKLLLLGPKPSGGITTTLIPPSAAAAAAPGLSSASSLTYSTDRLWSCSTPHGPKYSCTSRSAGPCSPCPASREEDTAAAAAAMDRIIQDPVSHLLQQVASSTATRAASPAAAATTTHLGTQAAHASTPSQQQSCCSSSSSTRPGVQVFNRNKAIQLEQDMQALPAGQLFTAQQDQTHAWLSQQHQHWKQQLQVDADLLKAYQQHHTAPRVPAGCQQQQQQRANLSEVLSQQLVPFHKHVDRLMDALAQQVSYNCVEHGRTLSALQDRYAEAFTALLSGMACINQHHAALAATAQAATNLLQEAQHKAVQLELQLSRQQAATEYAHQQLALLTEQHQQLEHDSQHTQQHLQQLVVSLKHQLCQARCELEQHQAAADAAAVQQAEESSTRLAEAEEHVCSLKQRLAFVHEQLRAVREQQKQVPEVCCAATQTDAVQPPSCEQPPDEALDQQPPSEASKEETDTEETCDEDASDLRKAVDLLECAASGAKRTRLWLVKLLGQITADKAVADAVADRQGIGRSSMADFIPAWSLTRYGLQDLSAEVLADLCASICHHASAGLLLPALWFACFCRLGPSVKPNKQQLQQRLLHGGTCWQLPGLKRIAIAASKNNSSSSSSASGPLQAGQLGPHEAEVLLSSAAAVDFWVFCACQLAYPNSVVALFPEAPQDALPLVKSNLVMESIKAAFRYLGESSYASFVSEKLDAAAAQPAAGGAAAAAGNAGSSRPATGSSSSVVGRFGCYDAWALLDLLLAEWLERAWARAQRMAQLRREAAALQPPLQQQYEAACTAVHAAGSAHAAALLSRLQEAYDALQPHVCQTAGVDVDGTLLLVQDATATDVDGVWQTYRQLLSLMQH